MDRGAVTRVLNIAEVQKVSWGRLRDDISSAQVDIRGESCARQADDLATVEPGRHEMVIWRGDERVWEGPIVRAAYTRTGISFFANDIMQYLARTTMHQKYDNSGSRVTTAVARCANIIRTELLRKEGLTPPVNVRPYVTEHHWPNEARTAAVTQAYQMSVFDHIDQYAQTGGMDYTVLGRAIHLWDTSRPLGYAPRVTDNDFLGDLAVTAYGLDLATRTIVTNGQGVYGVYNGPSGTGIDPFYGEWEQLFNPYDETNTGTAPTSAEMLTQAARNYSGRNPTPVQLRIPENSQLNPNGALSMSDLVPGVYVPVTSTLLARNFDQMQKLHSVDVTEDEKGETITVTLVPATQSDDDVSGAS